jgi:transposase
MGGRNIHPSAHRIAVRLVHRGKDSRQEICDVVGHSMSSLERALRRERTTGTVDFRPAQGRGRPRKLRPADVHYILQLSRQRPSLYLREYQQLVERSRLIRVPLSTLHNMFAREEITRKRTSKVAIERDPIKRAGYRLRISHYHAYQLVCVDEMSKDDRTYARPYARAERGMRAEEDGEFVRHTRYSLCAALALDAGIIAARVVEGSFNRDLFEDYLMNDVVRYYSYLSIP